MVVLFGKRMIAVARPACKVLSRRQNSFACDQRGKRMDTPDQNHA